MAFPDVTALIDNFNRADGSVAAGAGSSIWQSAHLNPGDDQVGIVSNRVGSFAWQRYAVSVNQYGPDVDITIDCPVAPTLDASRSLGVYMRLKDDSGSGFPSSNFSGFKFYAGQAGTPNQWGMARVVTAGTTGFQTFGVQAVAAGASMGFSVRGTSFSAYYKPSGGSWTQVGTTKTDTNYNRAGYIGLETSEVLDNLQGGTYTPVVPVLLAATSAGTSTDTGTLTALSAPPAPRKVVRIRSSTGWLDLSPTVGYYSTNTHPAGTTITIPRTTHGLMATRALMVAVHNDATGAQEVPDVVVTSGGDVTVTFVSSAPANSKRVTIIGPVP